MTTNTVYPAPVVRQFALGAAAKLSDVPVKVVSARCIGTAAWTYGDTPATALFPVPADTVEEIPSNGVRDTYFAGSGTLTVVFFLEA